MVLLVGARMIVPRSLEGILMPGFVWVLQQVLLGVQLREQVLTASSDGGVQRCNAGSPSRLPWSGS